MHLDKYRLSEWERERLPMAALRRIARPRWVTRMSQRTLNVRTWRRIDETYGENCSSEAVKTLAELGLVEAGGSGKIYKASKRGRDCLNRGYVAIKKDNAARNANIISVCALVIATALNERFWQAITWACRRIMALVTALS